MAAIPPLNQLRPHHQRRRQDADDHADEGVAGEGEQGRGPLGASGDPLEALADEGHADQRCAGRRVGIAVGQPFVFCNAMDATVEDFDTISTGATIAFAMECFEKGRLTPEETGGLAIEFGNPDVIIELVGLIAARRGVGDLLAEGNGDFRLVIDPVLGFEDVDKDFP